MYWKSARRSSISHQLLFIYGCSTVLMLSVITALVYPPLSKLLHQSGMHFERHDFLLTQICLTYFFIALWISAGISIITSYFIVKKSVSSIKRLSDALDSIHGNSLEKRLEDNHYPSELQHLVNTCNTMLQRIEMAFQHIKQFSASMAHELKNPVHYLKNATEVALAKPQTQDTYQTLLSTHLEEYHNLSTLIDNLLFLTRSDNGQIPLNLERVSARHMVQSIIEYYQPIAEEKEIELRTTGDAMLVVDVILFKRVLANILDNSLMHTETGGRVALIIRKQSDQSVHIEINDTGRGIARTHLPFLFQGFKPAESNSTPHPGGLGLGLKICKSIMCNHNGTINIDSIEKEGTRVLLTLYHQ